MVPDRPWHAVGALLGLDPPTMHLRLAQVITAMPPVRRVLDVSDRDVMVASAALFNSFDRSTAEVDAIARAIGAGARGWGGLAAAPGEIDAVASAAGLSAWRQALLGWSAVREPESVETWLSVRELFWLGWQETGIPGRGSVSDTIERPARLGCVFRAAEWLSVPVARGAADAVGELAGRAGSGLVLTLASDLSLWVAEGLYTRGLPATLASAILEVALRHLLDRVRPLHADDWDTVLRYPSTLSATDFGDYLSALTGTDVLRPARGPERLAMTDRQSVVRVQLAMRSPRCARRIQAWLAAAFALAALVATVPAHSQEGAPSIMITSPDGTRHLAGAERLAVEVRSEQAVTSVQFQVDGRQVCLRDRPSFECTWDAGPGRSRARRARRRQVADGTRLIRRIHTPARPRGGVRFTSSVDLVMVPVIVADRRGNYVTDIERNRFAVLEDGVPQDVIYFEAASDRSSLDLVVAIDISGSMTPTMPALKAERPGAHPGFAGGRHGDAGRVQRPHLRARPAGVEPRTSRVADRPAGALRVHVPLRRNRPLADAARRRQRATGGSGVHGWRRPLELLESGIGRAPGRERGRAALCTYLGRALRDAGGRADRTAPGGSERRPGLPRRPPRSAGPRAPHVPRGRPQRLRPRLLPADASPGIGARGQTPDGSFRAISVQIRNGRDYRLRTREGYRR